jgi:hypothetical protein
VIKPDDMMQQSYNCPRCNQYIQYGQPHCNNCGCQVNWGQPVQPKVRGWIAFYGLISWWQTTFTEAERNYIEQCFSPALGTDLEASRLTLTKGEVGNCNQPAPEFLNGLATWFTATKDASIAKRIHDKVIELGYSNQINQPGYFKGRHFTTYVDDVNCLKKSGQLEEAERLLLELVKATEEENSIENIGVAPWYYDELAKIYRKQKDYVKEVAILERYAKQRHAPGAKPAKLMERLLKARQLL